MDAAVVVAVAAGLTVAFVVYPLVLGLFVDEVFLAPGPSGGDVAAALLAHVSCALLGGALGLLLSPPRVARRATTVALVLVALLALAAIGGAAGPVAVADALHDEAAGALVAQCLGCIVTATVAVVAAWRWATRAG